MRDFEGAFISQNVLKSTRQIIDEDQGVISGQSKVIFRGLDGRPKTLFAFLNGWADDQNNMF